MSNERADEFPSWRGRLEHPDGVPGHGLDDREAAWGRLMERFRFGVPAAPRVCGWLPRVWHWRWSPWSIFSGTGTTGGGGAIPGVEAGASAGGGFAGSGADSGRPADSSHFADSSPAAGSSHSGRGVYRQGDYFAKHTFRVGAGAILLAKNAIRIEPCLCFNDFLRGITPGVRVTF